MGRKTTRFLPSTIWDSSVSATCAGRTQGRPPAASAWSSVESTEGRTLLTLSTGLPTVDYGHSLNGKDRMLFAIKLVRKGARQQWNMSSQPLKSKRGQAKSTGGSGKHRIDCGIRPLKVVARLQSCDDV